ncbi:MAG: flagellar basal-body rod protein FlgF [Candidatus Brocadiia bacterium]|jgi:flagellar basal-body rod protein FlgF
MSSSSQAIAGAMETQIMAQDVSARNIANVLTPGFKRNIALVEAMDKGGGKSGVTTPTVTGIGLDLSQGPLQPTGNDMNFGLDGEGFFAIETPEGTLYTRNGTFRLSENGVLVTQDGSAVLGESGQIQVPAGTTKLTVGSDGQLHTDSTTIGKLKLVAFDKPGMLQQAGNSNYVGDAAGPKQAADCSVHQGCLEASNVDPMTELVQMMSTFRDYQACARSLHSIEDSANKLYAWARS